MDGATSDDERNSSVGVVIRDSNESDYQSQLAFPSHYLVPETEIIALDGCWHFTSSRNGA